MKNIILACLIVLSSTFATAQITQVEKDVEQVVPTASFSGLVAGNDFRISTEIGLGLSVNEHLFINTGVRAAPQINRPGIDQLSTVIRQVFADVYIPTIEVDDWVWIVYVGAIHDIVEKEQYFNVGTGIRIHTGSNWLINNYYGYWSNGTPIASVGITFFPTK